MTDSLNSRCVPDVCPRCGHHFIRVAEHMVQPKEPIDGLPTEKLLGGVHYDRERLHRAQCERCRQYFGVTIYSQSPSKSGESRVESGEPPISDLPCATTDLKNPQYRLWVDAVILFATGPELVSRPSGPFPDLHLALGMAITFAQKPGVLAVEIEAM